MEREKEKLLRKRIILAKIRHQTFLSSQVGGFVGVAQSTIQKWTGNGLVRKGMIKPGTGNRRVYNSEDCVRCGIIKSLADRKIPFIQIKSIMDELSTLNFIDSIIATEYAFLIVYEKTGKVELSTKWYAHPPKNLEEAPKWVDLTCRHDTERVCVFNMALIVEKILINIDTELGKKIRKQR